MPNVNVLQMGIIKNQISITQVFKKEIAAGPVESDLSKLCKSVAGPLASAAAGAAMRYLLTGSTQDPTTALLEKIDQKLDEIKSALSALPNATTICLNYSQVLNAAKDQIRSVNALLSFSDPDNQAQYLSTLQQQQWDNLLNFLINSSASTTDYYTLIDRILDRTYNISIEQIRKAAQPTDLVFATTENCYASFIKKALFIDGKAGIKTFIDSQNNLMKSVTDTIGDITTCALKVYGLVKVAAEDKGIFGSLPQAIQDKIKGVLGNTVLQKLLPSTEEGNELPKLYTQLKDALVYAPVYICREAIDIYQAITDGHNVTIQNNGQQKYLGLGSHIEPYSNWTYKVGIYTDSPSQWVISLNPDADNSVKVTFPGIGAIYTQHGASDIKTCSNATIGIKNWFLGVAPNPKGGFAFVLISTELGEKQALVNYDPWIGSDYPAIDKLNPANADHQWLIKDMTA